MRATTRVNVLLLLAAAALVCPDSTVTARVLNEGTTGDPGGWTVALYFGTARTAPARLRVAQPALGTELFFDEVELESESFTSPLYYGVRAGYFLRGKPWLGFDAELNHLKAFSTPQQRVHVTGTLQGTAIDREAPLGEIVERYSISHGVNLLLFNVAVRTCGDTCERRWGWTGRVGAGPTVPHTESTIGGLAQEQYELGRMAWQAAAGAEFRVWKGLHAFAEYKFTRTSQRGKVFAGTAEALLRTHHLVFGASYRL